MSIKPIEVCNPNTGTVIELTPEELTTIVQALHTHQRDTLNRRAQHNADATMDILHNIRRIEALLNIVKN